MPKKTCDLTEAEWAIMKAVWEHQPCAAPSVQEALASTKKWSYSTVRTMMDRMVAKGLLKAEKIRHLTLYRPAVTRAQAQRRELLYTLKNAFNGALTPMVQRLLDSKPLSADDLAELESLIEEKRKALKKSGPEK
jgi:BlaI family transcriptional regulator, penicillinase repressor